MVDRVTVVSFSAVGSQQFVADRLPPNAGGAWVHAKFSGNGSAIVLANMFPDLLAADWTDVTSLLTGAAQLTPTVKFGWQGGFFPYGLRISVDSLQAANSGKFAFGW